MHRVDHLVFDYKKLLDFIYNKKVELKLKSLQIIANECGLGAGYFSLMSYREPGFISLGALLSIAWRFNVSPEDMMRKVDARFNNKTKDGKVKVEPNWRLREFQKPPVKITCKQCGGVGYGKRYTKMYCEKCIAEKKRKRSYNRWKDAQGNRTIQVKHKILDAHKLSDLINKRMDDLGIKSDAAASRVCGLHFHHIGHINRNAQKSITIKTIRALAAGLKMTEQEIIDQGGLAR